MASIRSFTATRRNLPHWQMPGSCYFLTWRTVPGLILEPSGRTIALNAIRYWDVRRWFLYAAVVMPDHAHALARPLPIGIGPATVTEFYDLSQIIQSVKGYSSHRINEQCCRSGSVWQDERYDRIVRDDREFEETWAYIRNNPVTAGLLATAEEYPWLYEAKVCD